MSLLLGVYSLKEKIDLIAIQAVIDNFSRDRNIELISTDKFILGSYVKYSNDCISEYREKNSITGVGGKIFNLYELKPKRYKEDEKNINNHLDFVCDAILKEGTRFINELNGVFSLVVYDKDNDVLHLANDHFGTYPLFVFKDENYFIFSNEYEPILKYSGFSIDFDEDGLAEYLVLGAPLGGKTFFKTIQNLKPCTYIKIIGGEITETIYDDKKIEINKNANKNELAEEFVTLFNQSIKLHTSGNSNLSCSLTGGLDTRLILCAMAEDVRKHTEFITLLTEPLTEEEDRDVFIARMIASELNLKHRTEPMSEWTNIWTKDFDTSFFEDVRYRNKPYILSGYYGSELIKGDFIKSIPEKLRIEILNQSSGEFKKLKLSVSNKNKDISPCCKILSESFQKRISYVYESLDKEISALSSENKYFEFSLYFLSRSFFTSIYGGSYGSWLAPYKFPIEYGLPFMDKYILKFLLSIPLKIHTGNDLYLYNHAFRKYFNQLNHIPSNAYMPPIKNFSIEEIKTGIEPKNIKKTLYKKAFNKCLAEPYTEKWQVFDRDKILLYKNDGNAPALRPFIELEIWLKYIYSL